MSASDAIREADAPREVAAARLRRVRPFYWSLRRELWEHRAVFIAPLVVGAIVLFAAVAGLVRAPTGLAIKTAHDKLPPGWSVIIACIMAVVAISVALVVVGIRYCLGALHGERRDRSILFWKSLPVSDAAAVLAKACVPLLVAPLVAAAVALATEIAILAVSTPVLSAHGVAPAIAWTMIASPEHLVAVPYWFVVLTLWYAPLYGWCLLISSWAKRAPFLWAAGPPFVLALVETVALGTHYVSDLVKHRLLGASGLAFANNAPKHAMPDIHMDPVKFFTSPGLWVGIVLAAVFVAAAAWYRRRREPI